MTLNISPSNTQDSVTVQVPATSANLGPGFDTLGIALNLYNTFTITPLSASAPQTNRLCVSETSTVETPGLPEQLEHTLIYQGLRAVYGACNTPLPKFNVILEAHVPFERGLGSSSTAIVAGLVSANHLLDNRLTSKALLQLAAIAEGHADNVAPALLGGCQLCDGDPNNEYVHAYPLPWPKDWHMVVAIPDTPLSTKAAREAMPENIPIADAAFTSRKMGLWLHALHTGDARAFKAALQDKLHQPYRGPLIDDFEAVEQFCYGHPDAMGCVISGSGSTLAVPTCNPHELAEELSEQFPHCTIKALQVDWSGAKII